MDPLRQLNRLHARLEACRACPNVHGPVVHGPAVLSRILLVGQAPGSHEASFGRPFAWTAGRTLFAWFQQALGVDEALFRERVYMAAVTRCFPGKAAGGGDRRPTADEVERCHPFLTEEIDILQPRLVLPVGSLAIQEVLGYVGPLSEVVGTRRKARYPGFSADVICLPHPSGASPWHRIEPGKGLLGKALKLIAAHPEVKRSLCPPEAALPLAQ
jgi:uracil-DNA glycosylase